MGANSTQAVGITLFLIGFTLLAGAFAGGGILYRLGFLVLLGISMRVLPEVQAVGEPERVSSADSRIQLRRLKKWLLLELLSRCSAF